MTTSPTAPVARTQKPAGQVTHMRRFVPAMVLTQLGFFVAVFTPLQVLLALHLNAIAGTGATSALGIVTGFGALCALVSNPIAGRISDRTRARLGRAPHVDAYWFVACRARARGNERDHLRSGRSSCSGASSRRPATSNSPPTTRSSPTRSRPSGAGPHIRAGRPCRGGRPARRVIASPTRSRPAARPSGWPSRQQRSAVQPPRGACCSAIRRAPYRNRPLDLRALAGTFWFNPWRHPPPSAGPGWCVS